MIRYSLKCANEHVFESWFQSADAYDALVKKKRIECPDCGNLKIEKTLMAPGVHGTKKRKSVADTKSEVTDEARDMALAELRKQVENNSEYVGMNFASEARAIHAGDAPERSIYGEAKPKDARALIEDGVPVTPLPFTSRRKLN